MLIQVTQIKWSWIIIILKHKFNLKKKRIWETILFKGRVKYSNKNRLTKVTVSLNEYEYEKLYLRMRSF